MTKRKHPKPRNRVLGFFGNVLFYRLLRLQRDVCAICKEKCKTGKNLAVDHDHDQGNVRGLLCARCNMILGSVKDDPDLLRDMARYLEERATIDFRLMPEPTKAEIFDGHLQSILEACKIGGEK